jgi:hypothetical protein
MKKTLFPVLSTLIACILSTPLSAQSLSIVIEKKASAMEDYAAKELQRYIYQISGRLAVITNNIATGDAYILGRIDAPQKDKPGPQGYILKKINSHQIAIEGVDEIGMLYGVYGFLEEHLGVSFSFDGDIINKTNNIFPDVDESKTPAVAIRGFLPWTNFPQSATSYSWEDWKFILDQMAKMRMNFLQIHNYNGEEGHNEMFHNFALRQAQGDKEIMSRVWMATAKTGHAWGSYPGWDVNKYPFGSSSLFDDYDFGADCALHNEKLDNKQVFRKGVNEFQRVIAYAHKRGIKIGLGLDINLIPDYYGMEPDDPKVIAARVKQVEDDYPDLDYLLCFQSEALTYENAEAENQRKRWRKIFDAFYYGLKKAMPKTRLAVAGWGLRKEDVASLPKDVICAPISRYSDSFEDGSIYTDHEYWGCPWMERDFYSSVYYYPYNMHLSNTIAAWQKRSPNMKGFYTLTWRITDAIKPKLWYMSRAPWCFDSAQHDNGDFGTARDVYYKFAEQQYGKNAADLVTPIINQNEPYASDWSECRWTPPFDLTPVDRRGQYLFNLESFQDMPAVNYASFNQAKKVNANGKEIIGYIVNGSWLSYDNVSFDPSWTTIKLRVSSATDGGKIELRLNAIDGEKIGETEIENTGGWTNWKEVLINIKPQSGNYKVFLVFKERDPFSLAQIQLNKANDQVRIIDRAINEAETPGQKYRLGLLKSRIAAERDHIMLNMFASNRSYDIVELTRNWAGDFNSRVSDISSLGNVVSMQNRFVQNNFVPLAWKQLNTYTALPPCNIQVRGTKKGAKIYWQTDDKGIQGFYIYRDGKKLNKELLPGNTRSYEDEINGKHQYEVHPVLWGNDSEIPSITVPCDAGNADKVPPQIVVISPPSSVPAGQNVWIKSRLLDNRDDSLLSATLYYRIPGETKWTKLAMTRRTKAIFTAERTVSSKGLEYYIVATDGNNESSFPADAPKQVLSVVQENSKVEISDGDDAYKLTTLPEPISKVNKQTISWNSIKGAYYYKIYRSQKANFREGPDNYLTYIAADAALSYTDNGVDLKGQPLKGTWYYRISAVDKDGYESLSTIVKVNW